jgi:exodeoxyribonuclease VII large subunit
MMFLSTLSDRRISPALARLDHQGEVLSTALTTTIARQGDRLNALDNLLQALSPQATLRRGYSITRVNGVVVTKAGDLQPGDEITTTLASGNVVSVVK